MSRKAIREKRDISSWLEENWGIISQQLAIKFEDRYNLLYICYIYTDKSGTL